MIKWICVLTASLVILQSAAQASEEPSAGAAGVAGAAGTIEFKPQDWQPGTKSWWSDSDGVDPGVAGCHIGTDSKGNPNGRMFGEGCLSNGLLVESNPAEEQLHSHGNDLGHPDTFDCDAWCKGNGADGGACRAVPAPPCQQSAICACFR